MRVQILAVHALEMSTRNDVEQVLDDAVGDEHFAVIVEVQSPRIRGSPGEDLKGFLDGVTSPAAAVERDAFILRRVGSADIRRGENAVATVASRPVPRSSRKTL